MLATQNARQIEVAWNRIAEAIESDCILRSPLYIDNVRRYRSAY